MNKAMLIGRLTRDPELKYTGSNIPVATFSIAINRPTTNQNGVREVDYINVVAWRKQAENIKNYIGKGSLVSVEGRIQTRNYNDKDGKKVYVTEIVADSVQFLESKGSRGQNVSPSDFGGDDYGSAPTNDISDDPYANIGSSIELSEDDIAF